MTLGGLKNTDGRSPTSEEKSLSFKNAAKLFWSLNGVSCDLSYTSPTLSFSGSSTIDGSTDTHNEPVPSTQNQTSIQWRSIKTTNPTLNENVEPKDRVCYKGGRIQKDFITSASTSRDAYVLLIYSGGFFFNGIIKMYNGDVNNENNFLGYGVATLASGGNDTSTSLTLGSSFSTDSESTDVVGYTDFCGIPICYSYSNIADEDDMSVLTTSTSITGRTSYAVTGGTVTDDTKIRDLTFYTYA
jgi:hypothetical protein